MMALYVVTGPPASGKSTWVRERARPGDVVIDMDTIAQALTPAADGTRYPEPVLRTAQRARQAAISEALKHTADTDVYVIHTQPKPDTLARYREHGGHVVTIDPGRDVVMQRIAEARHHTARAVAARWYATRRDTEQGPVIHSRQW
jgi:hypothetical protein